MFTSADTPPSETGHSEVAYSTGTAFDRPLRDDATRSMTSFPFSKMLMQPNPYMQAPIKIVHQPHLPSHLQVSVLSTHMLSPAARLCSKLRALSALPFIVDNLLMLVDSCFRLLWEVSTTICRPMLGRR